MQGTPLNPVRNAHNGIVNNEPLLEHFLDTNVDSHFVYITSIVWCIWKLAVVTYTS